MTLLRQLVVVSCFIATSVYAPPHEVHAKNSTRWAHGNHKAKRQSSEFAAAVNLRAKRTAFPPSKQGVSGSKHAKKTQRMALKRFQVDLEEMLDELRHHSALSRLKS